MLLKNVVSNWLYDSRLHCNYTVDDRYAIKNQIRDDKNE